MVVISLKSSSVVGLLCSEAVTDPCLQHFTSFISGVSLWCGGLRRGCEFDRVGHSDTDSQLEAPPVQEIVEINNWNHFSSP